MNLKLKLLLLTTILLITLSSVIAFGLNSILNVKEIISGSAEIEDNVPVKNENLTSEGPEVSMIDNMDLEEKVGQMFIVGYHRANIIEEQVELIIDRRLGGVILMGVNVGTPELRKTSFTLLAQAGEELEYPLIISVDEEGTVITRLRSQLNEQTPQSQLNEPDQAENVAFRRGDELGKLGFNVVYSPVMDYADPESFLYTRTFHVGKEDYAKLGSAMLVGFEEAEIFGVPKHFPGHPLGSLDSHEGLPVSNINEVEFDEHISQFTKLLQISDPVMIMTGHILFPNIDPENPATLSSVIIQDKLRDELGYTGLIVTDDLNMDAISERYTPEEAAIKAIEAGNDIVLYVSTIENQERALDGIIKAVRDGRISEQRVNRSVERIIIFKKKLKN